MGAPVVNVKVQDNGLGQSAFQQSNIIVVVGVSSSGNSARKCRTGATTVNCFPPRSIVNRRSCPGLPPSIFHTCPIVDPCTGMLSTATR